MVYGLKSNYLKMPLLPAFEKFSWMVWMSGQSGSLYLYQIEISLQVQTF